MALLVGVAGIAMSAETDPDGRLFEPSADALADVQQALERAEANDRLALIVVGGNWCHDSRALAARLNRSPLAVGRPWRPGPYQEALPCWTVAVARSTKLK